MTTTDLLRSVGVEALLAKRDAAVLRLTSAHALLQEVKGLEADLLGAENAYRGISLQCTRSRRDQFTDPDGLAQFVHQLDACVWDKLLSDTGIRSFMDEESRKRWDDGIDKADVPELTKDSIAATFAGLYEDRRAMFERGVVAVFKSLSWDYRSNSPVKFGKKIVDRHVVWSMNGEICGLNSDGADRLDDLLRVMRVLDGKQEIDHRDGAYRTLDKMGWPRQTQVAELHGLLSLRGFKNGNAHVTFLRPDLVDQLNRIVARHHPNALPPSREAA